MDRPLTFFLPSSPLSTALYVFADTFDKGKRASEVEPGEFPPETAPPSLLHFFDGTSCFLALNCQKKPRDFRLTRSPSFVEPTDEDNKAKRGAIVALDTLTWQMLASVFWPGSFIRCVVNATAVAVAAAHLDASVGADVAKAIPTVAGIAAIPFIVKPIDGTVDTAMEMSVTKALNGRIEGVQDAGVALATIGACLAVPPTLFSVAAAIEDIAV